MLPSLFRTVLGIAVNFSILSTGLAAQELRLTKENDALAEELRAEALVLQAPDDTAPGDLVATARGDYERLLAALYADGYFSAEVSITLGGREAAGLNSFNPPASIRPVIVTISQGSRFDFGRAEVSPLPPGAVVAEEAFRPGGRAGTEKIRNAARGAVESWREASHAKAQITGQQIVARHDAEELDVLLTVSPGPSLTFGNLLVPEGGAVKAQSVRRIAGLPRGEPFTPGTVETVRTRLVSTGAFASVVVREADIPNADGTLDVEVELEAAKPRRLGFGAEIDSTEGLSLEAFWLHRNIFGGAERLRFDSSVSGIGGTSGGIDYALGALLRIPGFRRAQDVLELTAALERLDEPSFEEDLFEIGARRARQVSETLVVGVGAGFRFSRAVDSFGTREFRHLILTGDATRDLRDNALNPRSGFYGSFETKPFLGFAGSTSGLRLEGDFRGYFSAGASTVLAGRVLVGSVIGPEIDETPPEFLFFSGGGGSVRGQGFQSLGVDDGDDTTGGRSFAGLSLEVRRDINETFGLVGFADFGYVAEDSAFEDGSSHAGAGLGLRYNTALGPLRVDVGVPVGGASDHDIRYGLYIGLGQTF
ncbi:MAG: BamA/TamA family outer membrane protein [Pseudomonadota bacterium]